MLSIKQRALVHTLGIIGAIIGSGIALTYASQFIPADAYPYIGTSVVFAMLAKLIYDINVSRLEYEERLNQMVDKK